MEPRGLLSEAGLLPRSRWTVAHLARLTSRYDERFTGYGLNKVEQLYAAAAGGCRFVVLPLGFVAAAEHPKSEAWRRTYGDRSSGNGNANRTPAGLNCAWASVLTAPRRPNGRFQGLRARPHNPERRFSSSGASWGTKEPWLWRTQNEVSPF